MRFASVDGVVVVLLLILKSLLLTDGFQSKRRARFAVIPSATTITPLALAAEDHSTSSSSEDAAMRALERLAELDAKLGVDCGATKERSRLMDIVSAWELEQQTDENDDDNDDYDEQEEYTTNNDTDGADAGAYVERHCKQDRIAIFGGDPVRRRRTVAKRMKPFKLLDQYGTPKDVGFSDRRKLLTKIQAGSYDVVYIWTRFGCHSSRSLIKDACINTGTRFVEIDSLSRIQQYEE